MPVDQAILAAVLRTPLRRDVTDSPIVTGLIARDPDNAADFVPYLDSRDELVGANARRILCLFGSDSAPVIVRALVGVGAEARKEGIEVLWGVLVGEPSLAVRAALAQSGPDMQVLLDDVRPLPDHLPEHVERDFRGRICDLAFLVVQQLMDSAYDQSLFRSLDDSERDEEIGRLKRRGLGGVGV